MAAGLPTAILVEVEFTAGVWTDIATSVVGDSIEIHVGRESAESDVQPGTLTLTLDNADGQWTPDNPTSSRYPNWAEGKRIRIRVTKGTTSTRFLGRITSIVPDFPVEPSQSRVQVTAVDGLGDLARVQLPGTFQAYALGSSGTVAFYPMNEVAATRGASDVVGGTRSLTVRRNATNGTADFSSTDVPGGDKGITLSSGRSLRHPIASGFTVDPASSGRVIVFLARLTPNTTGELFAISKGTRAAAKNYVVATYDGTSITWDVYLDGALEISSGADVLPDSLLDDGWIVFAVANETGAMSLSVSTSDPAVGWGVSLATATTTPYDCLSFGGGVDIELGGCWVVDGSSTDVPATVAQLVLGGPGYYGWSTIYATLSRASTFGLSMSGSFTGTLSGLETYGRSALDVLLEMASTESGRVYCSSADVVVEQRSASSPTALALTVDVELDAVGGPVMARSTEPLRSRITASSPTASVSVSNSSAGDVDEIRVPFYYEADLKAAAERELARGAAQKLRVAQVSVDLSTASNDLYSSLFGLTPGERVRLTNLPSSYFGVSYMEGFVEGWTERPGVTGYEVVLDLSPADAPSEGLWDDATYGRWGFGDGVATNSSSATAGATSVAFQWTGGLTLSTSAGDYPMDLDWNGERVTVTAAPAGGSSPQTLSLTRGVAPTVARAHNAGESVDIWNAARWAM